MHEMEDIGPVQLMLVGFEPGGKFEGRIVDELKRLSDARTIRVLDLLYVAKAADSDELEVLEHHEENLAAVAGALLGVKLDSGGSSAASEGEREHSFGLTLPEIQELTSELPRGASAGLLLIEHVWARSLKRAIRDAGGRGLGEGFLTPESMAAMEPKLAAISQAIRASK